MGSKFIKKKVMEITHRDIIAEVHEKYPDLELCFALEQYKQLQLILVNYNRNRESANHKIAICNLFTDAVYSINSEAGRN